MTETLAQIVAAVGKDVADAHRGAGKVADYIPALARVDPNRFGLAVITCEGETAEFGDSWMPFSIQSISKVFTLTMALERLGEDLWVRVGREPSGSRFNSIVQLEAEKGVPRNPFINAGAIVVTDAVLACRTPEDALADIRDTIRRLADNDTIDVDKEVAASEAATGFRNYSLANFMRGFDNLKAPVEDVLQTYFHQCSLRITCRQLARAGLFLANEGVDPLNATRIVSPEHARRINAIMMTCGHYDASGEFAFQVGLPGKSGVGGGILTVVPGVGAVAVWSPGLNDVGNSQVGTLVLERLASRMGWSVF
ncbi:MAG: glutaminase [Alphaproteobacteria bacterium]|nr:glutaminase [Alphaproteobacteria bacterium]MBU1516058.1 glutaminase [Alphaproteobacteria bacterium]MBU2092727.1 glutaminase [Alphaproteobacteria bacterium]MBU2153748.1 glutaminase [Alphaproteobacteria bacterium]MBU2308376.1 glutaminase [Alphaproteobacteria bacterium]